MAQEVFAVEVLTLFQRDYDKGWEPLPFHWSTEAERELGLCQNHYLQHVIFQDGNYLYYPLEYAEKIMHFRKSKMPSAHFRLKPL